ncbi:MAG: hypothetical protein HYW49_09420 [Deltaproteobacteria bacterium]|nr:hypothetical protein [Deltaproteobacteria bacterium]
MARALIWFGSLWLMVNASPPSARAADPNSVFAPECPNYCAFKEFEHNCHGIRFKETTGKTTEYLYTHWSKLQGGCAYNFPPYFKFAHKEDIAAKCDCGSDPVTPLPDRNEPLRPETAAELRVLRQKTHAWARCAPDPLTLPPPADILRPILPSDVDTCENMKAQGKEGYLILGDCEKPGDDGCSYFGNTNNVAGPFCLAGDLDRCEDLRKSQDPVTGAWFRNAFQRRYPLSEQGQPLFSRDEFLGMMLYLFKTRDKVAAEKWMKFLRDNPKKKLSVVGLIDVYNICPPRPATRPPEIPPGNWEDMLPDDRCEMRGDSWAVMYQAYRAIGFSDAELKAISKPMYRRMRSMLPWEGITVNLSVRTVPAVGGGAYQTGLQATTLALLHAMGYDNAWLRNAGKVIDRRTGYANPYYHWIASGFRATEYGAALIKKYCPVERPYYGPLPGGGRAVASGGFFDSGVQFFGGLGPYGAKSEPIGHDCAAWIDFYLGSGK